MIAFAPRPPVVFHIDADGLGVWRQGAEGWRSQARFGTTSADHAAFAAWLATEAAGLRGTVVVDSADENFALTTLPPASGRDRRALLQRALQRHLPHATCTATVALGREADGRRDERVLLCALSTDGGLTAWLDALRTQLGLVALYTPTLLAADLVRRRWKPGGRCVLAWFTARGMRHSFFAEGRLHFSRLATACHLPPPADASLWRDELRRTRAYLADQRLIEHDALLPLIVLAHHSDHDALDTALAGLDGFSLRFQPLTTISTSTASTSTASTSTVSTSTASGSTATPLFVQHAAQHPRAPHYLLPGADEHQHLQRQRRAVLGGGVAALALGIAAAIPPVLDTLALRTRAQTLADEFERVRSTLSAAPTTPAAPLGRLQALAAELDLHQRTHRPTAPVFKLVGELLGDAPGLELETLAWRDAETATAPPAEIAPGAPTPSPTLIELEASMKPSAPADRPDTSWLQRPGLHVLSQRHTTAPDGSRTILHLRLVASTPEAP